MTDEQRPNHDHNVVVGYPVERREVAPVCVGSNSRLRSGTVIYDGSTIGDDLQTGHGVVIREECEIGDRVSIWSNSIIDYGCEIGNDVKVHSNCYVAQYSRLGDGAFLAPGVSLANDLYPGSAASAEVMRGPTLGPRAQLGVNVTVLPFVHIGAGTIVGAGSVITRSLPPGVVAYGTPARIRGRVQDLPDVARRVTELDVEATVVSS